MKPVSKKKAATALVNVATQPSIIIHNSEVGSGQSVPPKLQNTPTGKEEDTACNKENSSPNECPDWLHRNDTYQRQRFSKSYESQLSFPVGLPNYMTTGDCGTLASKGSPIEYIIQEPEQKQSQPKTSIEQTICASQNTRKREYSTEQIEARRARQRLLYANMTSQKKAKID